MERIRSYFILTVWTDPSSVEDDIIFWNWMSVSACVIIGGDVPNNCTQEANPNESSLL